MIALHADKTDHVTIYNTPVCLVLAVFLMIKGWITGVQLVGEDVLTIILTTQITLTAPPCAVATIGELDLHSLPE